MSRTTESSASGPEEIDTRTAAPAPEDTGIRHSELVLLLLCMAQFMIVLDFSITNVALPTIQTSLGFSTSDLQWVVSGYALTFGGFLLLGGRVADLYGRKRLFIVGLVAFSLVSLIAGFAQNAPQLIALRGLQGLSAAFVAPAAFSLVTTTFSEGAARNRALSVWGAVLSLGFVSGVIAGGVLTDLLTWRWVFFVNVPIGLAAAAMGLGLVTESRGEQRRQLDVPGAVLITGAVLALVYALSTANISGWLSANTLGAFGGAVAAIALFVIIESRTTNPLIPLSIFRLRGLVIANLVNILIIGSFVGVTYVLTLYLQQVGGYSPLQTGLIFAVLGFTAMVAGLLAAKTAARFGIPTTMVAGLVIQGAGALVCAVLPDGSALAYVLAGTALVGFGNVSAAVMIFISGSAGVPDSQQGLAGGLLSTSQQLGAALGVAVFAAIATARTKGLLAADTALDGAGDAALVSGFRYALVISGITAATAAVLGMTMLRANRRQAGRKAGRS